MKFDDDDRPLDFKEWGWGEEVEDAMNKTLEKVGPLIATVVKEEMFKYATARLQVRKRDVEIYVLMPFTTMHFRLSEVIKETLDNCDRDECDAIADVLQKAAKIIRKQTQGVS